MPSHNRVGCHHMPLTDTRIRALKPGDKPTKHGDGGGLLLVVNPNGSKLWRMVYRYGGKQKQLAFGAWPDVSLAQARAHRDAARSLLADDVDGLGMMTQARLPWPRLQRPINARNQRSGFALICTPGKLALQERQILKSIMMAERESAVSQVSKVQERPIPQYYQLLIHHHRDMY
jgi:hypothetical protein